MSENSTPVAADNDQITAIADQRALRVAAANATRTGQKSVRRVVTGTRPTTTRKVAGGKAVVTKPGKATVSGKRTSGGEAGKSKPVVLSNKEAAELAKQTAAIQDERIAAARKIVSETDKGNWALAKLTFDATEADGPAKMAKGDWADAIGQAASTVSRWVKTWEKYGLEGARQYIGTGSNKRQLSFNDHVEMTKVADDKDRGALLKRMQAEKISFATALRRSREDTTSGNGAAKSKDKVVDSLSSLQARAMATGEDKEAAFVELSQFAAKGLIAFRQVLEAIEGDALSDTIKQAVRNVLNEGDEILSLFEQKIS